jgi:hypothetical protein
MITFGRCCSQKISSFNTGSYARCTPRYKRLVPTAASKRLGSYNGDSSSGSKSSIGHSLAYGSAQEHVARLLKESGAERMHAQMSDRFDQLGAIVAAERAERAASRATAAIVAAFAAAVVLGLPAIDQTLEIVEKIPTEGVAGSLSAPLRAVSELGEQGAYLGYLVLLAVLFLGIVRYVLPRRRRVLRHSRRAGEPWPGGQFQSYGRIATNSLPSPGAGRPVDPPDGGLDSGAGAGDG